MDSHLKQDQLTERRLWIAIVLNGLIPFLEAIGGILVGSLALISDAVHNLIDLFSLFLSLLAQKALQWKPNSTKTYGYGRLEIIVSVINSLVLLAVSIYIIYRAAVTLFLPRELPGFTITFIATGAFLANIFSALVLRKEATRSLNIQSAFLHLLMDAGQSFTIILAGIFISLLGWSILDPILSLIVGGFIFYSAYQVLREGLNILDEGVPQDLNFEEIASFIRSFPGVEDAHHLHVWSISTRNRALSVHLVLKDQLLSESGKTLDELARALEKKFSVNHPTFQVECGSCPNGTCPQVSNSSHP
jgi:cobalt-zinc-cadmium efflux system protein